VKKAIMMALWVVVGFLFVGCGSSIQYLTKPTPLKQESSQYYVKELKVNLQHGHGRNLENKTFADEQELKTSFEKYINDSLAAKNMYSKDGYGLAIVIDYTRTYNIGGNALNKPKFVYTVKVYDKANTLIASYSIPKDSTTKYSYIEDIGVNLKIAAFKWKAEDELRDVELISKTLVKEVSLLGD
jgi:hypothetical protein